MKESGKNLSIGDVAYFQVGEADPQMVVPPTLVKGIVTDVEQALVGNGVYVNIYTIRHNEGSTKIHDFYVFADILSAEQWLDSRINSMLIDLEQEDDKLTSMKRKVAEQIEALKTHRKRVFAEIKTGAIVIK